MFIGTYRHTLDEKRRVSIPSKLKNVLGKQVIITKGLNNCLNVYTAEQWKTITEDIKPKYTDIGKDRDLTYFIYSSADPVEVDSAGRILLKDELIKFADLKERIVIIGVQTRLEIWDEDKWDSIKEKIDKNASKLIAK